MTAIYVVAGFLAGTLIAALWLRPAMTRKDASIEALRRDLDAAAKRSEELQAAETEATQSVADMRTAMALLQSKAENLQKEIAEAEEVAGKKLEEEKALCRTRIDDLVLTHNREVESLRAAYDKIEEERKAQVKQERENLMAQIASEREHAKSLIDEANKRVAEIEKNSRELREESEKQWQLNFDKLKKEFQTTATEILNGEQNSLNRNNREQLGELLKPIQEQFQQFKKSVDESRTSNEVTKTELKTAFENSMKLFEQQQNNAVAALKEETARIGNDAANLTRVLRRNTKAQGDWGEMILESLLESSGLEKNRHYFVQDNVKNDEGDNFRPDVIVRFPEGRSVVIDSKVSLTAYAEAFETDDEEHRQLKLKEHYRSIKKHVDELAGKDYMKMVPDSIGFVLMFIPNDQGFLSALDTDKSLGSYAYSKKVIIITPSNLLIALQLTYHMWQQDRQSKNVEKIVKSARDLYDKVAVFADTMEDIEKKFNTLKKSFDEARTQLYSGRGNVMTRLESLKSMGVTPTKTIKGIEPPEPDE